MSRRTWLALSQKTGERDFMWEWVNAALWKPVRDGRRKEGKRIPVFCATRNEQEVVENERRLTCLL
jgi:hypothetical protein